MFQIIPRRYSGRGFDLIFWPRPYFTRIQNFLDPYGIELKKEVLLDENYGAIDVKGQIRWGTKKYEEMNIISEPFLIKALAENFDKNSCITANLSKSVFFVWKSLCEN